MKRTLICIICLLLTAAVLSVPVLAANSVSISLKADNSTVNSGDTVTVTVSATVDACKSGSIQISYSSSVFELVSGECLIANTFMQDFNVSGGNGVFAFKENTAISGNVFKFVLKVKNSAALGSSNVSVSFKADSVEASKSVKITVACAHKYDNSCDTTCNSCGATRTISHTWNSGKVTTKATCTSTGVKTYTCTVCNQTKTEEVAKTSHSYDNSCDSTCNSCGATRTVTHSYEWVFDETAHWEKCSVCGDSKDAQAHTFAEELSSTSAAHGYACTVCGTMNNAEDHVYDHDCDTSCNTCSYERTITHDYSDRWSSDENGHWHECTVCGDKLEMVPHTPGEEATETTDQICLDCGYVLQYAGNHEHTMAGDWLSNEVGHWYLCVCGEYTEPLAHAWDEGVIDEELATVTYRCADCGYEKTEDYVPPTTAPETRPTETTEPTGPDAQEDPKGAEPLAGFPWWIAAAVLAVLLIVSICFNIFLLRCLFASKKTGKYAKKEAANEEPELPAAEPEEPQTETEDAADTEE